MRQLKASLMMTINGVVESPHEWVGGLIDPSLMEGFPEQLDEQDTLLLGRTAYEEWSQYWPTSTDEPFASHINQKPKVIASRSLERATWGSFDAPTVLRSDLADEVNALKARPGKVIGINGSPSLVSSLIELGLLDELKMTVFPVLVGKGKRFFLGERSPRPLEMVEEKRSSLGVLTLTFRPRR